MKLLRGRKHHSWLIEIDLGITEMYLVPISAMYVGVAEA